MDDQNLFHNDHMTFSPPRILLAPMEYRADGALTLGGVLQIVGVLGLLGLVLGVLAGLLARVFYLVLLFPIVIGGCIGTAGKYCIRQFHIRNPLLCGFAGFLAGCLAMLAMHDTEFRFFEKNLLERSREWCITWISIKHREFKAERDRTKTKLV